MSYFADYPAGDNYRKVMVSDNIYLRNCANCAADCDKERAEKFVCNRHEWATDVFQAGCKDG